MRRTMLVMVLGGWCGAAAGQIPYVETFSDNVNLGGWEFVNQMSSIQPSGGNPGAFLYGPTFNYPQLYTTAASSPFTGDLSGHAMLHYSVDIRTFSVRFGALLPFTLLLITDNGTPADPSDDWGAYTTSAPVTVPGTQDGWRSFTFDVPVACSELPKGWQLLDLGSNPPPSHAWADLMRNVTQVQFLWAEPGTIGLFPQWEVGADNIAIFESGPACYANCDGSTTEPILNVNDFICFQTQFAAGSSYANCDNSTAEPVLNVNDFICFQSRFAAGCGLPCR